MFFFCFDSLFRKGCEILLPPLLSPSFRILLSVCSYMIDTRYNLVFFFFFFSISWECVWWEMSFADRIPRRRWNRRHANDENERMGTTCVSVGLIIWETDVRVRERIWLCGAFWLSHTHNQRTRNPSECDNRSRSFCHVWSLTFSLPHTAPTHTPTHTETSVKFRLLIDQILCECEFDRSHDLLLLLLYSHTKWQTMRWFYLFPFSFSSRSIRHFCLTDDSEQIRKSYSW